MSVRVSAENSFRFWSCEIYKTEQRKHERSKRQKTSSKFWSFMRTAFGLDRKFQSVNRRESNLRGNVSGRAVSPAPSAPLSVHFPWHRVGSRLWRRSLWRERGPFLLLRSGKLEQRLRNLYRVFPRRRTWPLRLAKIDFGRGRAQLRVPRVSLI